MRKRFLCTALFLCIAGTCLCSANMPLAQSGGSAPPPDGSQTIDLARSMQALFHWKFLPGDDLRYAQPDYDDSGWKEMRMEASPNSHDPFFSTDSYVPGWTARGFPNLTGFAWYRTRFHVAGRNAHLWLEMPPDVDDAYQLYANGQLVGSMGNFTARHVTAFYSRPEQFRLPAPDGNGDMVLALRFYMQPESAQWNFAAGGLHEAPVVGLAQSVQLLQARNSDVNLHTTLSFLLIGLLALIAGVASLWIYFIDRSDHVYLWLTGAFGLSAALAICNFVANMTHWISFSAIVLTNDVIGSALVPLFWLLFWACWFRLRSIHLVERAAWALVVLELCTFACLRQPIMGSLIPLAWAHNLWFFSVALRGGFALLLAVVEVGAIRQDRAEGWIALPAVVLLGINLFTSDLEVLGVPVHYFPLGLRLGVEEISFFVLTLVVLALVIRRFLRSQVRQQEMGQEMEQAHEVQALLVPERLPQTPGYRVKGTYLPASEVGGDFYQVLPTEDGGLIVALGDVSGKGLRAAMIVSMTLGALRAIVKETRDPAEILSRLNGELTGNLKSGFVTCICVCIEAGGTVTMANAGHLPPWVNGKEMTMDGALPLGVLALVEYETQSIHLDDGDTLLLLSDGVVEARSAKDGELYGFDRLGTMLAARPAAEEIARAAKNFGQEDDISVLEISRAPVLELAIA